MNSANLAYVKIGGAQAGIVGAHRNTHGSSQKYTWKYTEIHMEIHRNAQMLFREVL